jgi:plastocyanin
MEVSMVPGMRFVLVLVACLAALAAAPALAADSTVNVGDDFYDPSTSSADKGDTITWNWSGGNDHTVTSRSRQIDRFKSGIQTGPGKSFTHTFKYAGRFRYFCEIHPDSMLASVTVGTDDGVAPKITRVKGGARKVSFKLSERAVVTVRVKGRKKVVKTFGPGKHSVRYKRLAAGLHKVSLSAKDGFGHTGKKSKRFRTS